MAASDSHTHSPVMSANDKDRQKTRMRMILLSFAVSVLLMGLKFLTYYLTSSAAVLSDALESIINVVASAFAAVSVWLSAKPPDKDHPYGHGKIEYFSAGFEGALIICAAAGIFYTGITNLLNPQQLPYLKQGLLMLLAATIVNVLLGISLLKTGKRTDSITLIADGKHIITDVYTSVAVILGLAMVYWTGWLWVDGALACLVGVNILITGSQLVKQSFARLMDASDTQLLDRIVQTLEKHRQPEWIDIHQLRAWRAGNLIHIDLHLVLPKDLSMDDAHAQAMAVETLLINKFEGNAGVLVHMDPCDERLCPICSQNICQWRTQRNKSQAAWDRQHLIRSLAVLKKSTK